MSKPQRRKGNAKNASSAAAHGYLAGGGSSFIGLTPEMNIFEMASGAVEAVAQIPDEARIILRKLIKKDACTREKGLRELISYVETEEPQYETCYEHFCGIAEALATDGSSTVRLLTMKCVSMFIGKMKKAAAKGLKKIMPMVLFELCDSSNSVCASADAVLRENFGDSKRQQAFQVFGPSIIKTCVEIAFGNHDLCKAAMYDEEESVDQRKYRLEVQSLAVCQRIVECLENDKQLWMGDVQKLVENQEFVKKTMASEKHNLKSGVLSLCLKLENHIDIMMNGPLCQWIQNSLDSDNEGICDVAWSAFVVLLNCSRFYEKVSLTKTLIPRIQNVIRRKSSHWNKMGPHLLPMIASIFDQLKAAGIEQKFIGSLLESYLDNVPFDIKLSTNCGYQWSSSFTELIKWTLSNSSVDRQILDIIVPVTVKMCIEVVRMNSADIERNMVGMIHWIFEKKLIDENEALRMLQLLQGPVISEISNFSNFIALLLSPGKYTSFCSFHAHIINIHPQFAILKSWVTSSDAYFKIVAQQFTTTDFLNKSSYSKSESDQIIELITRLMDNGFGQILNVQIKNNVLGRELLLKCCAGKTGIFEKFFENLPVDMYQNMVESWQNDGNGKAVAIVLDFLLTKNIKLDAELTNENVDYIVSLIESSKNIDTQQKEKLGNKLFHLVFHAEESPKPENIRSLSKLVQNGLHLQQFFEKLFSSINDDHFDTEKIRNLAARFDALIDGCDEDVQSTIIPKYLINQIDFDNLLEEMKFLEIEAIVTSNNTILPCKFGDLSEKSRENEQELRLRVRNLSRLVVFNVVSKYSSDYSNGYAAVLLSVVKYLKQRYVFNEIDEETQQYAQLLKEKLKPTKPLHHLLQTTSTPHILLDSFEFFMDEIVKCRRIEWNEFEVVDLIEKFKSMEDVEFLETIRKCVVEDGKYDIFVISESLTSVDSLVNLMVAKKFVSLSPSLLSSDNKDLIDFLLCGLITVVDSLNDIINEKSSEIHEKLIVEQFAAIYLQIYANLEHASTKTNEITPIIDEWREFYSPTIVRIVFNWFGMVQIDSHPTPFVRSYLSAISEIKEFPQNLDATTTLHDFVPELDSLNYSQLHQSLISHAFGIIDSKNQFVQLIGHRVVKLMMSLMVKTENPTFFKESAEEVITSNGEEIKMMLPVMMRIKMDELLETGRWAVVYLFDACLTVLEKNLVPTEHRMAYCDALQPIVKKCLTTLTLKQPLDLAKSKERDYYLTTDPHPSSTYYEKFAARLLFVALNVIPASVRLWYKSLPNSAISLANEVFTKSATRLIVESEIEKVKNSKYSSGKEDFKIRAVPVTSQIIAEHVIDETKVRLTITMLPDFPLSIPTVEHDKDIMRSDKARKWLLQLNAYLFHQNGAILDGIEMWKRNIDKGMEGAEDCTICMMTIHSVTHQLPKVKCKQCKNKFHSHCLYKWFESSNQSTCPLCRTSFT